MLVQVVLRHRMQQDIEMCANMQVGVLQSPRKSEDQRDVFLFIRLLADDMHSRGWASWETAGQGRIVVYVELEEMVEGVGHAGYGAVDVCFNAVV